MLTSAGVAAPDGNELAALQTGLWGAFLQELHQRQSGGLNHAWVSFFTYDPRVGAEIFADWVKALPNLRWISGQVPLEVLRSGDRITGVRFADYIVQAHITLDGTELGDLLALGQVPYRWGWEMRTDFGEPSAPLQMEPWMYRYPVQSPTWVVILQDFGEGQEAPVIAAPPIDCPEQFELAWSGYGAETFLNYGRLPGDRFMINWPHYGNDYGEGANRLLGNPVEIQQFWQEACWHSQSFARFIQTELGRRYGLADTFPLLPAIAGDLARIGGGAFALHPYFRESRRLRGVVTVREQDILPVPGTMAASLPVDVNGQVSAIAIGNYPNDHHYPHGTLPLQSKAMRWGGRWTGTPFALPYGCLVPEAVDGLLVCEKNISVSHIANGATRLQPIVLGIGQAAGMAAALCIARSCQPRELPVADLQTSLLTDSAAPAAVVPLLDSLPGSPNWLAQQYQALKQGEWSDQAVPASISQAENIKLGSEFTMIVQGKLDRTQNQAYQLSITEPVELSLQLVNIVTLHPDVHRQLSELACPVLVALRGNLNSSGHWFLTQAISYPS
jgi:hypothetical protein